MDEMKLKKVFENFPGIYRRSKRRAASGEYFYALQARYAQRTGGDVDEPDQVSDIKALSTDKLQMLIDFVLRSAEQETASRRAWIANAISMTAAIVAAIAAIVAAVASHGH
jgi:hypothetical protein